MPLVYALLVGIAMGALIQRVGASSPTMILAALRLENLTIIKFMATTIAVGMIGVYLLGTSCRCTSTSSRRMSSACSSAV